MPHSLATQLDSLPRMSKDALSALWQELFQSPQPDQLRRQLMARILAYRIQEQAFRGLTLGARQRLRQIGPGAEQGSCSRNLGRTRL
jgi:hypothetical protein